ncbi:hypothetical protein [Polaromonas sp. YR568]|uniref:hypothetical protein n=1 Tax=Polaromonas sp. YR568 TaxID=1855301 RepID=UPI00398BE898
MNINEFKNLLMAFADDPSDVDIRLGQATFHVREEVYDVRLKLSADEHQSLVVVENDREIAARTWLLTRVAHLPQLAEKIINTFSTKPAEPFVTPSGNYSPDIGSSSDGLEFVSDAVDYLANFADRKIPGATSVLYLTSDAGEGKTTVINRIAVIQAKKFKARTATTLIVPIPLSGRAFLTFDDAVIAALVNKLRFNYFYFDAFLALIRIGAIIPAFDGYEEMLVEGSKGEAVSALGGIVQSLDSSGTLIVAARKAFFDYLSFKSQAKLLDAVGNHSASFFKMEITRWTKDQFIDYGNQRGIASPEAIYGTVATRLGAEHPLLTRAVLVRRLFDVMSSDDDRMRLAELLGANPHDYFFTFVDAIVKREATEKWLSRVSGEVMEPLLPAVEHHELLAQIALEMWQASARSLRPDVIDLVVDIFSESRKKPANATRQIRERIKQHSLLAVDSNKGLAISFDHEDFQDFYLGEGLGRYLAAGVISDLYSVLSVNVLSKATVEQSIQYLVRVGADLAKCCENIKSINQGESGFSFCKENCGLLAIRMAEYLGNSGVVIAYVDMYFGLNSLSGRSLHGVTFERCHFQPFELGSAKLNEVVFLASEFERIDIGANGGASGCKFVDCKIDSLLVVFDEEYFFDPVQINERLKYFGADLIDSRVYLADAAVAHDDRMKLLNRFFRIFMRATQVNEDVIRLRLGSAVAAGFLEEILPLLISHGILSEVTWDGRGNQRRYRLATQMATINEALEHSHGSFDKFIRAFE